MTMKLLIVYFCILTLVFGAPNPKSRTLKFRSLYKEPLKDVKNESNVGIINGHEATPHTIPYQAFLEIYSSTEGWWCSGALISENYVLTAAHCVIGSRKSYVSLGVHNWLLNEDTQVLFISNDTTPHEYYDSEVFTNDIALIKLPESVNYTYAIQPISLPNADEDFVGHLATISGWGLTANNETFISDVLNYAQVHILSNEDCETFFGSLPSSVVCSSGAEYSAICEGDGGAPLVTDGKLVGIASFTVPNCLDGYPSAFSRVSSFLEWIANNSNIEI